MFATRVIDNKDIEAFNKFVFDHSQGHFLQLWNWGEVKSGTGWKPLPLVLEKNGEICAALLLLKRALPIPFLKKCILYAPRGPVVIKNNSEYCKNLFLGARQIAKNEKAIFIKIDPAIIKDDQEFIEIIKKCGFIHNETGLNFEGVQPSFVFRLSIDKTEEELLAAMHPKWRYNIRLAAKKGVTVREAADRTDLKNFYELLSVTSERDRFLIREFKYFEWIWDYMVAADFAKIFLAEYEGTLVSATLALRTKDTVWYLYGASSNEYRNVMPNYLIQWEMIRWAKSLGCKTYDFRGVSGDLDEDNPLYGLYRFKKGFGGELVEFIGEWDLVNSKLFYWAWNHILPLYLKLSHKQA